MSWIKKNKSALLATLIVALFTAYWTLYDRNLTVLFAAAMALIALGFLMKSADFLALWLMLVPNVMMVKLQGYGFALLGYVGMLFALRLIVLERKRIAVDRRFAALVLAHLTLVFLSVILNRNTGLVTALARLLGFLTVALWIVGTRPEREDGYAGALDCFVFGCVLNVLSTTLYHELVAERLALDFFAGINNDRNYFSIALAVAMQFALIRMLSDRRIDWKNSLFLVILLYGGVRSASRTFLVLCLPAALLFAVLLFRLEDRRQLRIVLPALGVLAVGAALTPLAGKLLEALTRFTGEQVLSLNLRTYEWAYYLSRTFSAPLSALFGAGSAARVIAAGEYPLAEHSSVVQALFETGIMGFGSFLAVFAALWKKLCGRRVKIVFLLPLLTTAVGYCMISAWYSDILNTAILLSFLAMTLPGAQKGIRHEARAD